MGKYARTEGMGSGILHQVCQVSKIHEVGLELLWRNLPLPYPRFGIRYLLIQPFFEIGKPFEIKAGLEKW